MTYGELTDQIYEVYDQGSQENPDNALIMDYDVKFQSVLGSPFVGWEIDHDAQVIVLKVDNHVG